MEKNAPKVSQELSIVPYPDIILDETVNEIPPLTMEKENAMEIMLTPKMEGSALELDLGDSATDAASDTSDGGMVPFMPSSETEASHSNEPVIQSIVDPEPKDSAMASAQETPKAAPAIGSITDPLMNSSNAPPHLLIRYLERVIQVMPRLNAARTQILIEQAKTKTQRSSLLPKLDFAASAESSQENFDGLTRNKHPAKVSLLLEQPIFDREAQLGVRSSQIEEQVAQVMSQSQVQDVIEESCRRYLDLHRFQQNLEFSRNNSGLANEHLRSTRIRQEKGELTLTDVNQALVRFKTATAVNRESTIQVTIAKHRLEEFIQEDPQNELPIFSLEIPKELLDQVESPQSIFGRPDLRILSLRLSKEEVQAKRIKSQYLPQLFLNAEQARSWDHNVTTTTLSGNPLNETSVSLNLSLNLFNGGHSFYQGVESSYRIYQFQQNLQHQQLEAKRLLLETVERLKLSQELTDLYGESVDAAKEALHGIQQEFLAGTRTALDAFDAQNELFISQTRWLNAKIDDAS